MTEKAIQKRILLALGSRPDVRLWRQNTGVARALSNDAVIAFGIPGQADLTGIVADGRRLEVEVKSEDGRQTPQQKRFEAMIHAFGGIYILARSVEDATAQLEVALKQQPEAAWRTRQGAQRGGRGVEEREAAKSK